MNTLQSPSKFLLAILDGFLDGILVFTPQKQLLYINSPAHRFCQPLLNDAPSPPLPTEIWQVCEALLDNYERHPDKFVEMVSDIQAGEFTLRVRARWLFEGVEHPCFLVRLQNQHESLQTMAIAEAQTWHLTKRETQVWKLRRVGLQRKQIAAELYISEDTVKKHLGNVTAKRQSYLDDTEWQHSQSKRYSA